jgi:hypothetical protein
MAYANMLASISEKEVAALRTVAAHRVRSSLTVYTSHLTAYWIEVQPLGDLLGRALDGGEIVIADQPHPLRPPVVHRPETVRRLTEELRTAWDQVSHQFDGDGWTQREVTTVLRLFAHAGERDEYVLSYLG